MSALYIDEQLLPLAPGTAGQLIGPEARHAAQVAKLSIGEEILVSNGKGLLLSAEITATDRELIDYRVHSVEQLTQQIPQITLLQSLAKGGRDELAIQTATELGVSAVIPWQADRSIVRWTPEKAAKNHIRWQNIVRDAAKQSKNAWVPEVRRLLSSKTFGDALPEAQVIVLEPQAERTLQQVLGELVAGVGIPKELVLVVGPEGGITDAELKSFTERGAQLARIGDLVLRSSTAGPVALALIHQALGKW